MQTRKPGSVGVGLINPPLPFCPSVHPADTSLLAALPATQPWPRLTLNRSSTGWQAQQSNPSVWCAWTLYYLNVPMFEATLPHAGCQASKPLI